MRFAILYFLGITIIASSAFAANKEDQARFKPSLTCANLLLHVLPGATKEPSLLAELRQSLLWLMEKNGYQTHHLKTKKLILTGSDVLAFLEKANREDAEYARGLLKDANCEFCAIIAPPETPATRAGVSQFAIAQTLRDVAQFLLQKNIGPEHNKLALDWLSAGGLAETIAKVKSQEELQKIFGAGDTASYYPGKIIPTLIDVASILRFLAYRDDLERLEASARTETQNLIDQIEAFRGTFGARHCSIVPLDNERINYIKKTKRSALEKYEETQEPGETIANSLNSINLAFGQSVNQWLPTGDGKVEWHFNSSNSAAYDDSQYLAQLRATLLQGYKRAGIKADVAVKLGPTYGEDELIIQISLQDFLTKFVPALTGQKLVNVLVPERPHLLSQPALRGDYLGWLPGRTVFFGPQGLYIAADAKLPQQALQNLAWLRQIESQRIETVVGNDSTTSEGTRRYNVLVSKIELSVEEFGSISRVGGRYWRTTDLLNEQRRLLGEIALLANGLQPLKVEPKIASGTKWSEHQGVIYIPYSDPYHQAALQIEAKYQAKFKIVFADQLTLGARQAIGGVNLGHSYAAINKASLESGALQVLYTSLRAIEANLQSGGDGIIDLETL